MSRAPREAVVVDEVAEARADVARRRLLAALERLLEEKPFGSVSVNDIVAAAGTSKRTFYQHYPSKGACLIDHHERFSDAMIEEIGRTAVAQPTAMAATREGIRVYFRAMAARPGMARAHLFDLSGLGPEGMAARSRAKRRYAAGIRLIVERPAPDGSRVRLPEHHATGLVGALDELALRASEEGRVADLEEVVDDAAALFRSVVKGLGTHG